MENIRNDEQALVPPNEEKAASTDECAEARKGTLLRITRALEELGFTACPVGEVEQRTVTVVRPIEARADRHMEFAKEERPIPKVVARYTNPSGEVMTIHFADGETDNFTITYHTTKTHPDTGVCIFSFHSAAIPLLDEWQRDNALENPLVELDARLTAFRFLREGINSAEKEKNVLRKYKKIGPPDFVLTVRSNNSSSNIGFSLELNGSDGTQKALTITNLDLLKIEEWLMLIEKQVHIQAGSDTEPLHRFNLRRMGEVTKRLATDLARYQFVQQPLDAPSQPGQFAARFKRNEAGETPALELSIFYERGRKVFTLNSVPHNPEWYVDKEFDGPFLGELPSTIINELQKLKLSS